MATVAANNPHSKALSLRVKDVSKAYLPCGYVRWTVVQSSIKCMVSQFDPLLIIGNRLSASLLAIFALLSCLGQRS